MDGKKTNSYLSFSMDRKNKRIKAVDNVHVNKCYFKVLSVAKIIIKMILNICYFLF